MQTVFLTDYDPGNNPPMPARRRSVPQMPTAQDVEVATDIAHSVIGPIVDYIPPEGQAKPATRSKKSVWTPGTFSILSGGDYEPPEPPASPLETIEAIALKDDLPHVFQDDQGWHCLKCGTVTKQRQNMIWHMNRHKNERLAQKREEEEA